MSPSIALSNDSISNVVCHIIIAWRSDHWIYDQNPAQLENSISPYWNLRLTPSRLFWTEAVSWTVKLNFALLESTFDAQPSILDRSRFLDGRYRTARPADYTEDGNRKGVQEARSPGCPFSFEQFFQFYLKIHWHFYRYWKANVRL